LKNLHIAFIGFVTLISGIGSLIVIASFWLNPDYSIISLSLVVIGLTIALISMVLPLKDEDFSNEELRRMGVSK